MSENKSKSAKRTAPARKRMGRRADARSPIVDDDRTHVQQISNKRDDPPHLDIAHSVSQLAGPAIKAAERGYYVYGIVAADKQSSFGKSMMGGGLADVFAICHEDLAAVTSMVNAPILDSTRENVLAHQDVVGRIMETDTIIPMCFGVIFKTSDDVQLMLKSVYTCFQEVLHKLEGKIEFGLKVTWDRDGAIERLKREKEEIRRFDLELKKKRMQSTYFARMQLARMIETALMERSSEIVQEIYEGLRPVCLASRDNKPIGETMIMNAAFLLERKRANEFDQTLRKISKKFDDLLDFKYSGPWPPYNFVSIRLKLERAQTAS